MALNIKTREELENSSKTDKITDKVQDKITAILLGEAGITSLWDILDMLEKESAKFPKDMQDLRNMIMPFTSIDALINSYEKEHANDNDSHKKMEAAIYWGKPGDIEKNKQRFIKKRNTFVSGVYKEIQKQTEKKPNRELAEEMIENFPNILRDFKVEKEGLRALLQ